MLTLAQYNQGKRDKLDTLVIDEFRRSSVLLDRLYFDDAVSATGSGSTLTYGYMKLKTPSGAATRPINSDYNPNDAEREEKQTHLVIMGGSYQLDRVVAEASGNINEVEFQTKDKVRSTSALFNYLALNGTSAQDSATLSYTGFDGLSTLLADSSTESTSESVLTSMTQDKAFAFLSELDELIGSMSVRPDVLMMNAKMLTKMIAAARSAGYLSKAEDAFGRQVVSYNGIPIIDAGSYYDKTKGKTVDAVPVTEGKTDIFAINFDQDGFIGVTLTGGNGMIKVRTPDFTNADAVQKGSVELVASVALKNTKKAGVLRGVTISA